MYKRVRGPNPIGGSEPSMKRSNSIFSGIAYVGVIAIGVFLSACGHRASQNSTPPLRIMYNTEEEPAEKSAVAQVIQSQLAKAGIPVTLEPVTNAVFYDRIGSGNYQAALGLWYWTTMTLRATSRISIRRLASDSRNMIIRHTIKHTFLVCLHPILRRSAMASRLQVVSS